MNRPVYWIGTWLPGWCLEPNDLLRLVRIRECLHPFDRIEVVDLRSDDVCVPPELFGDDLIQWVLDHCGYVWVKWCFIEPEKPDSF